MGFQIQPHLLFTVLGHLKWVNKLLNSIMTWNSSVYKGELHSSMCRTLPSAPEALLFKFICLFCLVFGLVHICCLAQQGTATHICLLLGASQRTSCLSAQWRSRSWVQIVQSVHTDYMECLQTAQAGHVGQCNGTVRCHHCPCSKSARKWSFPIAKLLFWG